MPSYQLLAKILKISPPYLQKLDSTLAGLSGRGLAADKIVQTNAEQIKTVLKNLGLNKDRFTAEEVFGLLTREISRLDQALFDWLGQPVLAKRDKSCGRLCQAALDLQRFDSGFFIKKTKAQELLFLFPPQAMIDFLGYANIEELLKKEELENVLSALRFMQSQNWMHDFFDQAYRQLKADDFEERSVDLRILPTRWLPEAGQFTTKKYHNVSHLKEWGIIFITPLPLDAPGKTLRLFSLLLHYLHEVPFYSNLFRQLVTQPQFIANFQSLLRGDVPLTPSPITNHQSLTVRIVQRYLAKDDPKDWRLFEAHFNPEAEHWFKAWQSLSALPLSSPLLKQSPDLEAVGGFFGREKTGEQFISFNLMDLIMSVIDQSPDKFYHQQEALWNKIFIEHWGRDKMNELVAENMLKGFIAFQPKINTF